MTSVRGVRRRAALLLVGAGLVAGLACESSSSPAPTAPSGVLAVSLGDAVLKSGTTTTATATAAGSPVAGTAWSTSDGTVATVDASGRVLARRAGRAVITATSGNAAGQASVLVVSDFAGTWTGPLARSLPTCAANSTAAVCRTPASPEALLASVTLSLVQTGATVTGTLVDALEPGLTVVLSGDVSVNDTLTLSGSTAGSLALSTRQLAVTNLRATFDPTIGTITGSYTMVATVAGAGGAPQTDYSFQAQFRDLPRR